MAVRCSQIGQPFDNKFDISVATVLFWPPVSAVARGETWSRTEEVGFPSRWV